MFNMPRATSAFKRVPVGEDIALTIKSVEFKPNVNPSTIITTYHHADGGELIERTTVSNDISMNIFRTRFDTITSNAYKDVVNFEPKDIVNAMVGKTVLCTTVENEYNGKNYVNLKYIKGVVSDEAESTADFGNEDIPF